MALGLWDPVVLDERTIELPSGSTLLMYTDGMTDCRDTQGEAFGLERIKKTLSGLAGASAQEVCDQLFDTLMRFQDGSKQDDDVTLVAVHAMDMANAKK
jgi:sigma-B regulation protein RsbU (phosphoserine phosphatase)